MRANSKKGQIEISFNWIFILIAGAAILIFFTFIIIKETSGSERELNINLQKRMESLLSTIEKNPASIKNIGYFAGEMKFSCEQRIHEFYVDDSSTRMALESELIYAPARVGKSDIITWTVPLKAPYKISNLLLISDSKTLYVFEDSISSSIQSTFPSQFSSKTMTRANIAAMKDEGHEKYIILLSEDAIGFNLNSPSLKEKGKTTIITLPSNLELQAQVPRGVLNYYEYTNGANGNLNFVGDSYFVTKPLLFGAIISGSPSLYNCSTDKVIKRIRSADELNKLRVGMLEQHFILDPLSACSVFYGGIEININSKLAVLDTFYSAPSINEFQVQMINLIRADEQLLSLSCPLIGVYEGTRPGPSP